MRVMVIPEDPTHDQHILKPIVKRIFKDLKTSARVEVLQDPHLGSVSQALDREILASILDQRRMFDLFLLMVDRDCEATRETQLKARMDDAKARGRVMLGCLAIEEVEVWALALHRDELDAKWSEVRKERDPKETYFEPLVVKKSWQEGLGKGRAAAMKDLPGNWRSLKSRCPELERLQDEIGRWLASRNP